VDGNDFSVMNDGDRTRFRRHKIGFVFQRFNLLPTLTARQNIHIAQDIQGNGFNPHRLDMVVDMLGIREKLNHKPFAMSGGEQQRVAIARAVICEPKILLADEPTGNLDTENSQIVLNMMRMLNRSFRQTILMITHNPEAAAVSDRVVRMRDGRVVSD
jgi:putative ABC transport system ATP-binding protein